MLRYLEDIVTLQLNAEACNGCGMCVIVCPHEVFKIDDSKAVIVNRNACIECGACAINCPVNAVRVQTGAGCATAILRGALGKECECSGSCGVSPAVNESEQTGCSGARTGNGEVDSGATF